MGLKGILHSVLVKRDSIVFFISFIVLCSAAPAKPGKDRAVLSWLEDWNAQLHISAVDAFNKYNYVHFVDREDRMPFLALGILNSTIVTTNYPTTQSALHAICRQLLEFVTPVYLAYYDESQRLNSDAELTKILLNASAILNSTTETAKYLHVRKFPDAKQPQVVKIWSRSVMNTTVAYYKNATKDKASLNALRSWATLNDLMYLSPKLSDLFKKHL